MKIIVLAIMFSICFNASPKDVTIIQFDKNYDGYSDKELKRRVWRLEKAVRQLQEKVFNLQTSNSSQSFDSWICTISSMGNVFTATGATKAIATHNATEKCKEGNKGEGFFCNSNIECKN